MKNKTKAFADSPVVWAIVSLLGALFLWLYVTSTEGVASERTITGIPVELEGEEELRESSGLLVTDLGTNTVNVKVSGMRRYIGKLSASNMTAKVDLGTVRSDGHYTLLYELELPDDVNRRNITIETSDPEVVNVHVERLISKSVMLDGSFTGNTADGYLAEETLVFDPLSVKVSGPKSVVDTVASAWVEISREGVDASLNYSTTYTLLDKEGKEVSTDRLTVDTDEVNVTLTVLMTKSVALTASLIDGGGATEKNAIVRVEPDSITLAGTAEELAGVNRIVVDTVNLANVNALYERADIPITLPNNTVNLSGNTSASVRIEISGVVTATVDAVNENIVCTNIPEGYTPEVITKTLPVLVRALPAQIEEITGANLRVVADLSNLNVNGGIQSVPVKITIDGYPEAGTVGDYKIHLDLVPVTP